MIYIKMMAIICYLEDEASCDNVTHCTFIGRLALIKFCFIVARATFPKFHNKSTWQPKGLQALEAFAFSNDCQLLRKTDFRRPCDNLSPSERSATQES